ncbi:MAG TPA: hypothetical protein VII09_08395, partial [Opitutaceae bacterium]
YSLTTVPAAPSSGSPLCFRFNPLGADMPLFNNAVSQGTRISAAALPVNVSNRLSRRVLCRDIQSGAGASYYGEGKSLSLSVGGTLLDPFEIRVCDLSGEEGGWANMPDANGPYLAAIDPELGRIALRASSGGASPPPAVSATFHHGFNADMGGGEYPRTGTFSAGSEQKVVQVPGDFATLQPALDSLSGDGVVEITDSDTHAAPSGLAVAVGANGHIELRAADGCRPTLMLGDAVTVSGGAEGSFDMNGLCVAFAPGSAAAPLPVALLHAPEGPGNGLAHLGLTHCTLVPGWALDSQGDPQFGGLPGLVAGASGLAVVVQKSILGAVWSAPLATVSLSDSILDATDRTGMAYAALDGSGSGGALTLTGCTVVGKVRSTLLSLVSNSIIWAALSEADLWTSPPSQRPFPLWSDRKQEGCVRFSFLPETTAIPRQFECVMQGPGLPAPLFVSLRYGDPGYGKLYASTVDDVRRGADDGGEMGAFHFVLAPLRETDLRTRMQEYIPVGLEYGIFYET